MAITLRKAAKHYWQQYQWVTTPLTKDGNGLPKIPITTAWTSLPAEWKVIEGQAWDRASGIGIVLGPVSQNLAVIDLDDAEAADMCFLYKPLRDSTRLVKTARNRGHIYVTEMEPTLRSESFKCLYQGREIQVELKSKGTQVAAPPSPGYEFIGQKKPWVLTNIEQAWRGIADHHLYIDEERRSTQGYPQPWRDEVPDGERNQSAYVEAHQLREAGVPLPNALEIMAIRVERNYIQGDMRPDEVERTVRSAYTKGPVQNFVGGVDLSTNE